MIVLALLGGGVTVAVVLAVVLGRPRANRPGGDGPTPLERAQDAARRLTPHDRQQLRRWLEEQNPPPRPPPGGEGITR
jgi:hypothetical protein